MLYVILAVIVVWGLAAVLGVGKNTVFTKPHTMSDVMIERTIRLSQQIMDNSSIGSKAWSESGAKFTAALNEQRRRAGLAPIGTYNQPEKTQDQEAELEEIVPPITPPLPLPVTSQEPLSELDENKLKELCDCFGYIMMPQLGELGINPGNVEHASLAGSSQACGYIQGLCASIVDSSGFEPNDEYGVILGSWAFDEIYGSIGHTLHIKTMEAVASKDMSAIHGFLLAREDIAALSEKRPGYEASGFQQIASGALFKG